MPGANNSLHALAERQKIFPIMFIGNHHIYKSFIVNDMKIRAQPPREVADYISRNKSFCRSADTLHGEGGDYVTGNEN